MKKIVLVLTFLAIALLLTACGGNELTYNSPGKIIINVTNDDIALSDIQVSATDDAAEIDKSNGKISISVSNLLRKRVTLAAEGYVTRTVLVRSIDYNAEGIYETQVTLEENYIFLALTIVTNAAADAIELTSDDIVSLNNKGKVFDIKFLYDSTPELTVSAEGYSSYTLTLNESEIQGRISARKIMLVPADHTLVEIQLTSGKDAYLYTNPNRHVSSFIAGNKTSFAVPKDCSASISVQDTINMYNYGNLDIPRELLSQSNFLSYSIDDLSLNMSYTVIPYMGDATTQSILCAIAKKVGSDFILQKTIEFYEIFTDAAYFSPKEDYYIFVMGYDGKIRYKEMDISHASPPEPFSAPNFEVRFEQSDPTIDTYVKVIDIAGDRTDFSGVRCTSDYDEELGEISDGNILPINPQGFFREVYFDNIPEGYRALSWEYFTSEDRQGSFLLTGIYEIVVAPTIDIYVHIDSASSYEGMKINNIADQTSYYFDENNTAFVSGFDFSSSFYVDIGNHDFYSSIGYLIGNYKKIKRNEAGEYHVTISL